MNPKEMSKKMHDSAKIILDTEVACLPDWKSIETQLFDLAASPQRVHDTVHSLALIGAVLNADEDKRGVKQLEFVTRKFAILIACVREAANK